MIVLLLILKIILIIIAVILSVVMFLLILILFVPICYNIKGEKYDEIVLEGKASWLLDVIKLKISFKKEVAYSIKVFWKTIYSSQVEEPVRKNKTSSNKKNVKESKLEEKAYQEKGHDVNKDDILKRASNDTDKKTDKAKDDLKNTTTSFAKAEDNKKIKEKKVKKKNKKIKIKKKRVKEESSNLKDVFHKIQAFLKEDYYKGVVKFVTNHGWKMIKSILPRKIRLHLQFGTDDPAITGYILGVVSIFYAVTGNSMVIEPDFDKRILKGNFDIKGRIFIFILVYHALKIILDKRVKKLIAEYNH
ncbi:MAG: hypothetical protein CVU84_02385 [Firmicutes bacterium HGW-Firmicutes-1]|jgi:hypothetical protein|nr:MAG: hypothetical protein CVU84_02385 [Firmicutes bacterium HGW-Firmicutes-1]